jgi:hypothetical protein
VPAEPLLAPDPPVPLLLVPEVELTLVVVPDVAPLLVPAAALPLDTPLALTPVPAKPAVAEPEDALPDALPDAADPDPPSGFAVISTPPEHAPTPETAPTAQAIQAKDHDPRIRIPLIVTQISPCAAPNCPGLVTQSTSFASRKRALGCAAPCEPCEPFPPPSPLPSRHEGEERGEHHGHHDDDHH